MDQKIGLVLLAAMVLSTSCGTNIPDDRPLATEAFLTDTLSGVSAPAWTVTPAPPALLPTTPPIEGITTTQVNVRSEASTAGNTLGTIAPFSKVQILGMESNGAWYQIIYGNSTDGKGWVTSIYVQVDAAAEIPVIQTEAGSGISALVVQPIKIRSGPGTSYDSVGSLSPNDVVTATGRDSSGDWIQIKFKTGTGWVASQYLKISSPDELPVTSDTAQISPTEASTESRTPIPTGMASIQDNDSKEAPSVSVQLSSLGAGTVQFSGSVSPAPAGDAEDWLQFRSDGTIIILDVKCPAGGLHLEIWDESQQLGENILPCEETQLLEVQSGRTHWLRIVADETAALQWTPYILMLKLIR